MLATHIALDVVLVQASTFKGIRKDFNMLEIPEHANCD